MSLTPEQLNATLGVNLALNIIKQVGQLTANGVEATTALVTKAICDDLGIDTSSTSAKALRHRIRYQVPILEAGGQLTRKEKRDKFRNITHKTLHLP